VKRKQEKEAKEGRETEERGESRERKRTELEKGLNEENDRKVSRYKFVSIIEVYL
jgi:hypothetical protein